MPQFVVLTHDHPFPHWDLLLDTGTALRTWRLLDPPDTLALTPAPAPIRAEPLPDHRREYLTYEGPVTGGRGQVHRWDAGEYTLLAETPDRLDLHFSGQRLHGPATLTQTTPTLWTLTPTPKN